MSGVRFVVFVSGLGEPRIRDAWTSAGFAMCKGTGRERKIISGVEVANVALVWGRAWGLDMGCVPNNPPPPGGGGAEGDGGGGHGTKVTLSSPSVWQLPATSPWRGRIKVWLAIRRSLVRRHHPGGGRGPIGGTSPTERCASLLRPFHLGPGLRRGGRGESPALPLDDRPDLRGQGLHRERLGDHRHPRLQEARRERGVFRIPRHEQHAEPRTHRPAGVGDLATVQPR